MSPKELGEGPEHTCSELGHALGAQAWGGLGCGGESGEEILQLRAPTSCEYVEGFRGLSPKKWKECIREKGVGHARLGPVGPSRRDLEPLPLGLSPDAPDQVGLS